MTNYSENEANKALKEYLEAVDNYNKLVDKYFPVRQVIPGKPITLGEPFTESALREFEEAETRVSETYNKWHILLGL